MVDMEILAVEHSILRGFKIKLKFCNVKKYELSNYLENTLSEILDAFKPNQPGFYGHSSRIPTK